LIDLSEAKTYLRVDFEDDDAIISAISASADKLCRDITRLSDEDFEKESVRTRIAQLYAIAYLYEHREDADMEELNLMLRAILFGVREVSF